MSIVTHIMHWLLVYLGVADEIIWFRFESGWAHSIPWLTSIETKFTSTTMALRVLSNTRFTLEQALPHRNRGSAIFSHEEALRDRQRQQSRRRGVPFRHDGEIGGSI